MKKAISVSAITAIFLIGVSGIFLAGIEPGPTETATQSVLDGIANADNKFAFDLYSKYKSRDGNIFFSPYSIYSALAMTYEGAGGKTAEEMQGVFHFPADADIRRTVFLKTYRTLNKKNKKYKLNTANALWVQKDYQFRKEYLYLIDRYYGGKATNLDFINEPEKSRTAINNWVEKQTNNKIKNLIPAGVLDELTRLVLTNAIYFKGVWARKFDKKNTKQRNFKISPGREISVPMMNLTDGKTMFNYTETDKLQVLELPYKDGELSIIILLPKENDLTEAEKSLSVENLTGWREDFVKEQVDISLPKFKFDTKYFIAQDLAEMGMPTAFSDDADFSGMTGKKDLHISKIIHQAFIELNEEGTEAAAATAVVMALK